MPLIIVSWVLASLVIIITIARVIGRALITKQTGWDDFFMVLGSLSAVVCSALVTVGVSHGLGRHEAEIKDPADRSDAIKYSILALVFHLISSTTSKISILIFLARLIGISAKRWQVLSVWGLGAALTGLNLASAVVTVCLCDPPRKQWQPSAQGACLPSYVLTNVGFVQGIYSALMDIIAAVSPVLFITQLNITRKTKLGLSLLMGGGILAAGAAIVKAYFIIDGGRHDDITFYWAPISLWYTAEMNVVIITGTIPTLWPLSEELYRLPKRAGTYPGSGLGYQGTSGIRQHADIMGRGMTSKQE
ncbi:hypothetical protein F4861DRAFT_537378 [Xylaria intraflava]|nr:hypothetical protein F4861DRAFT_537378 [Xylaria intraflava]